MTLINEDFDGGNKAGVGYDHTWTEFLGSGWSNSSSQAKLDGTGSNKDHAVRCDTTLDGDDHYAFATLGTLTRIYGTIKAGPLCRKDNTNTRTYYTMYGRDTGAIESILLSKIVAGSETVLDSENTDGLGSVFKCECDGNTIKGYLDDVEKFSESDSAISGNTYTGLHGYDDYGTNVGMLDDFEAGDLAAAFIPVLHGVAGGMQQLSGGLQC